MKSRKIRYCVMILVVLLLILLAAIFYCPHKETYTKIVKESNCFEVGQIDVICGRCDTILESNTLEKIAHDFGDYELIINPSVAKPGVERRVCNVCLKEEKREYYCSHNETYSKVIKESTCYEIGRKDIICKMCETVLESSILEKTAHTFGDYELIVEPSAYEPGLEVRTCSVCLKQEEREYFCVHQVPSKEEWTYTKYATPFEDGERYTNCYICGVKLSETYTMPVLENNSVYITGTDIKHGFTISSFTQSAVDKYDIVYTEEWYLGESNPFILGHNFKALGMLYQTKVGTYIYLNINGVIEIYEVIVSEYAFAISSNNDIVGQTTGTSIWHQYETKTLHMYTCYGIYPNGRWMVLAKKIY